MGGTLEGGRAAARTNKKLYGKDFYRNIGSKGGKISKTGGFYANPELAKTAGAIGGRISKRGPAKPKLDNKSLIIKFKERIWKKISIRNSAA